MRFVVAGLDIDLRDVSNKGMEFHLSLSLKEQGTEVPYSFEFEKVGNHFIGATSQWLMLNQHRKPHVKIHLPSYSSSADLLEEGVPEQ
jgi:hypothetical protein